MKGIVLLLVVEDDDLVRQEFADVLRDEGYSVVSVRHGGEALDYLHHGPVPDLILLDMLMPVCDGWRFLQRWPPTVPIIVMTGSILSREWAQTHDCVGFLHKPVEADMLLTEVSRCLTRQQRPTEG